MFIKKVFKYWIQSYVSIIITIFLVDILLAVRNHESINHYVNGATLRLSLWSIPIVFVMSLIVIYIKERWNKRH